MRDLRWWNRLLIWLISIVTILPNEFHGVIGDHGEDMPIEHIRLAHDKKYLVSSGHDNALRFWDVAYLYEEEKEEEEEEEKDKEQKDDTQEAAAEEENDSDSSVEQKPSKKKRKTSSGPKSYKAQKNAAFFADM